MTKENTKKKCLEFLKSKNVAVLSTVSSENQPMSAAIYYILDEKLTFYFMSKKTNKLNNIHNNKKVAMLVTRENAPICAQIHGVAEEVTDGKEYDMKRDQLIQALLYTTFPPPIFEVEGEDIFIYKITPTWIRWLDMSYKIPEKGFKQILP